MSRLPFLFALLFIFICFVFNILGLMKIYPLYLTSPLLFLSVLFLIILLNNKHRFRGFRR
nr:hypothetical protein [Sutcliffiella halmapala]